MQVLKDSQAAFEAALAGRKLSDIVGRGAAAGNNKMEKSDARRG